MLIINAPCQTWCIANVDSMQRIECKLQQCTRLLILVYQLMSHEKILLITIFFLLVSKLVHQSIRSVLSFIYMQCFICCTYFNILHTIVFALNITILYLKKFYTEQFFFTLLKVLTENNLINANLQCII